MTDNIQSDGNTPRTDWDIRCCEQARLFAELLAHNKAALFDALAQTGITRVLVEFDGYGDSGQIENIDAFADDAAVALPATMVEYDDIDAAGTAIERQSRPLRDAIEALVYDVLHETYGNWEDNDGAYGDFTFDVAKRTITLAYNERHMESDYHERVF